MLSHIDRELFPDRCEVVVFDDPQRYVYPMFKNGRSALLEYQHKHKLKILLNQQIQRADVIDIYLRDPLERFVSGINSFCQITQRDNPELDAATVIWFAERYLFLNRHYCTQFAWILNLSRYMSDQCKLSLRHVDQLKSILSTVEPDGVTKVSPAQRHRIVDNPNLQMFTRLDQSLVDLAGNDFSMAELCKHMRDLDPAAWDYVINSNIKILNQCIVQD
jgi:hypothetical protein